jgi:hypothetical protein
MLQFKEFDPKTGKSLTDYNPAGDRTPRVKEVKNSYLETWLETHQIEPAGLYVANFYDGVNDTDRRRREAEGKVLIFTSGGSGYFTDPICANLIATGDPIRKIQPIYADSQRAAHNAVAYGSLVVSDGKATAQTKQGGRILIIDDEKRSCGRATLVDRDGRQIPAQDLENLFDKMGDGTMLVPTSIVRELMLDKEIILAIDRGLQHKNDELGDLGDWIDDAFGDSLDPDLANRLLAEYKANGKISNYQVPQATAKSIARAIDNVARSSVLQFRAATPDLPGIAKGTVASSFWCKRLGVDAIVSTNDIKGDDGRLKQPGILDLDRGLWIERKIKAEWSNQTVGSQVKGTIPTATLNEFNPMMAAKAAELADIAIDNWQVAEKFVEQEDRKRARNLIVDPPDGIERVQTERRNNQESVYKILKADRYGQLNQLPNISRQLKQSLRRDRLDVATSGITVPAAIAQHHSKLEPWEVCNRDLPHGAIVAYYRSPFPNVGAAAIAINNLDALRDGDLEAFNKQGVIYLNPWTAKNIAITDFDGDRNGCFVGYVGDEDLPDRLRAELCDSGNGGNRYEAGRAALAQIITQPDLERATYPLAVKELIESNAPEKKPLPIAKAKKADHPWHEDESLTEAIWRAWEVTANNPTGKVANQAIVLQSLAAETIYIDPAKKPALLKQIAKAYAGIPIEAIPSDEYLIGQGLPAMELGENILKIVEAAGNIDRQLPDRRVAFAERNLQTVNALIKNYSNSAVAKNLQTAVDTAKSSNGIDDTIHDFGERLQYKKHELRLNVKKPEIYLDRDLPTNTQEPIGWAVETANEFYRGGAEQSTDLGLQEIGSENLNRRFRSLLPNVHTERQKEVVDSFARQYKTCTDAIREVKHRIVKELPEDRQPTLTIVSSTGKSLTIQRLCDVDRDGTSPVWDLGDGATTARFEILRNQDEDGKEQYVTYLSKDNGQRRKIGFVTPESAVVNQLSKFPIENIDGKKCLTIDRPSIEFHPPYSLQNDIDRIFASANQVIDRLEAIVPIEQRLQYASAAWRTSAGMGMATKVFPDRLAAYLDRVPSITLNHPTVAALELEHSAEIVIRFDRDPNISLIAPDGSTQDLGMSTYGDSPLISPGTVVRARISRPLDPKIRIATENGEFVVTPAPNITQGAIEPTMGNFILKPGADRIEVSYLKDGNQPVILGVLGRELVNKESRKNLSGSERFSGTMSRGVKTGILEIQVLESIAHQPVAAIDRGESIPLPPEYQPVQPEKLPPSQAVRCGKTEATPTEDRGEDRYHPSAGELREMYSAANLAGDTIAMSKIKKLGIELNDLYGNRAPDDYRNPVVAIVAGEDPSYDRTAMEIANEQITKPSSKSSQMNRYNPSVGELRVSYLAKQASNDPVGMAKIIKLGQTLANFYPHEGKAPDDYQHPAVSIGLNERELLLSVQAKDRQADGFNNSQHYR